MKKFKLCKRILALLITGTMLSTNFNNIAAAKSERQQIVKTITKDEKKNYIVATRENNNFEKTFVDSNTVNQNEEHFLEKNDLFALELNNSEVKRLEGDSSVQYVEEDVEVEANAFYSVRHNKKVKQYKKNKSDMEWNIRMIHGEQKSDKHNKKKVKIAVLDSGVDYGNDIDLQETTTLVPGEEGINPLFMDGTGHGNSVAGLIAASENGEGITGINPNAEIYSIRVLDDNNQAPISRVIEGIYMAIHAKVNIINMSFGVNTYSEALHQAIKDANNAGILLIAAAGNTGSQGVQYPAAFDEVMAVGSVDKRGDIAKSSAVGKEIEIMAPGELVRSTGMFGDQLVSSGTSLAAPQVAAAASLIWQKDLSMPPEFVRYIINSSANLYGDREKYGNGLLDVDYALNNYKKMKKNFMEKEYKGTEIFRPIMESNSAEVCSFEDTGCVEGSWTIKQHGDCIPSDSKHMKAGAKFNDDKDEFYKQNGKLVFKGMEAHPWWHGYYKLKSTGAKCNYISTYIYETKWANYQLGGIPKPSLVKGLSNNQAAEIEKSINKINWNKELGTIKDRNALKRAKRAFLWGMAIHNLTDAFSHSTYVKIDGKYKYVAHGGSTGASAPPHNTNSKKWAGSERLKAAEKAAKMSHDIYLKTSISAGTFSEFAAARTAKEYKMANIYKYMREVAGDLIAGTYKNCNYDVSVK